MILNNIDCLSCLPFSTMKWITTAKTATTKSTWKKYMSWRSEKKMSTQTDCHSPMPQHTGVYNIDVKYCMFGRSCAPTDVDDFDDDGDDDNGNDGCASLWFYNISCIARLNIYICQCYKMGLGIAFSQFSSYIFVVKFIMCVWENHSFCLARCNINP